MKGLMNAKYFLNLLDLMFKGKCTSCAGDHIDQTSNCATFGKGTTTVLAPRYGLYLNTRGEPPFCCKY